METTEKKKMSKKLKISIIVISCLVVIGLGVGLTLFLVDNNNQNQENQYINNLYEEINTWDQSFSNSNGREQKIDLFMSLSDLRNDFINYNLPLYHQGVRETHYQEVVNRIDNVLNSQQEWFRNNYVETLSSIETLTTENLTERETYVDEKLQEINLYQEQFSLLVSLLNIEDEEEENEEEITEFICINNDCVDCENGDCEECVCNLLDVNRVSYKISLLNNEVQNSKHEFEQCVIISEKVEISQNHHSELSTLLSSLHNEISVDVDTNNEIENKITLISNNLETQINDDDKVNILSEYDKILEEMYNWLLNYYQEKIDEISERERQNQNDKDTIGQQVVDLEYLKIWMVQDGVISQQEIDGFVSQIDELLEEYQTELDEIEERERLERERRERERRERERRQNQGGSGGSSGGSSGGGSGGGFGSCPICGVPATAPGRSGCDHKWTQ